MVMFNFISIDGQLRRRARRCGAACSCIIARRAPGAGWPGGAGASGCKRPRFGVGDHLQGLLISLTPDLAVDRDVHENVLPLRAAGRGGQAAGERRRWGPGQLQRWRHVRPFQRRRAAGGPPASRHRTTAASHCSLHASSSSRGHGSTRARTCARAAAAQCPAGPPAPAPPLGAHRWPGTGPCPALCLANAVCLANCESFGEESQTGQELVHVLHW